MGLFNKKAAKEKAIDFAKDQIKDELKDAAKEKLSEVVTDKTLNYAMENAGASLLPWWVLVFWWPIKQVLLLISWPIRVFFKKKK